MKKKQRKALKAIGSFLVKLAPFLLAIAELLKAIKD